ncbi:Nitrogen regulation protein NtrY [hydrothermal vent metagenome]|uniref:histidine kinase n=1 Tax=hydrothermal vent metagenome TaxID=652676 RepID=A0A3B1DCV2_9ZZZZ
MKTSLQAPEKRADKTKKQSTFRPVWITGLFLTLSISLTVLLFQGIEKPSLFSTNILMVTMVNLNITLAILLVLLLSRNLVKLYFERRVEPNKSSLRSKLIAGLIGLSMIPSILLFVVASGLLTSSIDNWFSIQVEKSLDQSLEVAQDYYEETEKSVSAITQHIALKLTKGRRLKNTRKKLEQFLQDIKQEHRLHNLYLFTPKYKPMAEAIGPNNEAHRPDEKMLVSLFEDKDQSTKHQNGNPSLSITSIPQGDLVRGILPLEKSGRRVGILIVEHLIPSLLVGKMEGIKKSVQEYKQLKAFKNPIKGSYILSFLIIVFLIIFSATWFGLYLAKNITGPIQKLAEGTQAIAQGDLDVQIDVKTTDELGILVDSFNKMTTDLKNSHQKVADATQSLMASNKELEGVLTNIAAGVISVNEKGIITTFNPSAERILGVTSADAIHTNYIDFFTNRGMKAITHPLQKIQEKEQESLQEEVALETQNKLSTLRMVLSVLHGTDRYFLGYVIVFDDLTELIRAQKLATWQEVARRIAHEIRNPLTPIQLSTERLRKKYFQGSEDFDRIFDESTQIVINEVHGLKMLVDEFSDFARMPPPRCSLQEITPILQEVISLYQSGHKDLELHSDFDPAVPAMNLDREQIKRLFLNLFENAVTSMQSHGVITLTTQCDPRQKKVRVSVADEGIGIPPEDLDKLFLPYFSRSKTGTGLGLAIVNRIATDHNAQIRVSARQPKGTTITIEFSV